jgi:inosose dehydratase
MCPLPDGVINIAAVVTFIDEKDFDGPIVVEQDMAENAPESPMTLARRNLAFLKGMA